MTHMVSPNARTTPLSTSQAPAAAEVKEEKTKEIFALSFGPGAFDTMVQLGVTHALLVSRRRPPDVVLGLSAEAANAVALGEVFAEEGLHSQVSRFRPNISFLMPRCITTGRCAVAILRLISA